MFSKGVYQLRTKLPLNLLSTYQNVAPLFLLKKIEELNCNLKTIFLPKFSIITKSKNIPLAPYLLLFASTLILDIYCVYRVHVHCTGGSTLVTLSAAKISAKAVLLLFHKKFAAR